MDPIAIREALTQALSGFDAREEPLRDRAAALFDALGYGSRRTMDAGTRCGVCRSGWRLINP